MNIKSSKMTFMLYLTAVFSMLFMLVSNSAMAGTIVNSDHDLQAQGLASEICVACHTPHNADVTTTAAPLWNHALTSMTYTLYGVGSTTLNATLSQPDGISKLCLSCHDGSVALDSFGGTTGGTFITPSRNIGGDAESLTDDHPISFTYDADLVTADAALNPVTTTVRIGDPSGVGDFKDGTIDTLMLFGGRMECASCHDVHNKFTNGGALLRISTNNSDLCLTCHDK